jgi:uncharacterized membrane protein YebE (DUF533 family)
MFAVNPIYSPVQDRRNQKGEFMGIFDKLTGKTATLTPKSALVLSAITVIAADGVIDEAELNDLAKIVRGDRKSIDVAMDVMRATKFPGVIDLVAATPEEKQRLATLVILCGLAMAEGTPAAIHGQIRHS